jgi:putative oxidoreductase
MAKVLESWSWGVEKLGWGGGFLPQIMLRTFLAYEFWESGIEKYQGSNWFGDIQSAFPFPFNLLPPDANWNMAMWFELLGATALILGLATRFFSLSLIILTIVAWAAVHSGNGYNVCDNGYKLPLMYLVMFLPLFLNGGGKASLDHLLWTSISSRRS